MLEAEWSLGNVTMSTGQATRGLNHYLRARTLAEMIGDRLSQARLTCNIGARLAQLGCYSEARAAIEESRAMLPDETPLAVRIGIEQHYGVVLDTMGEGTAALEAYARAAALARRDGAKLRLIEILCNTAFVHQQLGDLTLAHQTYHEALAMAHQHQQNLTAARILMNLGELAVAQGRLSEAGVMLRQAVEGFRRQDDPGNAALAQSHLSRLFRILGLTGEAVAVSREAVTALEQTDWKEEQALALMELLRSQHQDGLLSAATASADAALALWEALENPLRCAEVIGERAALALERRRYDQALADARAALDYFTASAEPRPLWAAPARLTEARALHARGEHPAARRAYLALISDSEAIGDHWTLQAALSGLGWLEYRDGQSTVAVRHLTRAAANLEMVRRTLTVEELKARFLQHHNDVYDALVSLAAASGDATAALTAMLRARGGGLLDMLQVERTYRTLPSDEYAELETLRRQLALMRANLERVTSHTSTAAMTRQQQHLRASEARLLDLLRQRQHRGEVPDLTSLLTPSEVAAHLPPDAALLEYYQVQDRLWGVLLRPDGTCDLRLLGTWTTREHDLLADLDLICSSTVAEPIAPRATLPSDLAALHARLHHLWKLLLAPWGPLPPRLFLTPHGPLGSVPFAALWDGRGYVGETHTIAMLPSGSVLVAPRQASAPIGPPLVLGYSDGGRLPATQREAREVGHLLGEGQVFTEEEASSTVLRSLTAPPAVLHIAAHAALRHDAPLFSMVRLSDGDMALETWYDLPLHGTRLVVLSACDTGQVADQGGPLLAFQGALLGAGVRTMVCSLWMTSDVAAEALMPTFYRAWVGGAAPAEALRLAQQEVRSRPELAHPALWASFICCGAGALSEGGPIPQASV
ncbi:MAG: CHAT domain-containing protein [Chloroflexaceae bacterium]|nr:CHAT domain-containing protein [Chloroflexaceae bacterium]